MTMFSPAGTEKSLSEYDAKRQKCMVTVLWKAVNHVTAILFTSDGVPLIESFVSQCTEAGNLLDDRQ